ncbi:MAG TPA: hypothetical protein VJ305_20580 [Streptosporangiaceae bacterium]|jgi:hypothetical protein|nr:hypothetical protein [Streptosporangiaceae bacterium]
MSTGEAEFISQTIDKAVGPGVYVREGGRGMYPVWPADQDQ